MWIRLQLVLKFDWIGIFNKLMATNQRNALTGCQRRRPLIFFSQHFRGIASKGDPHFVCSCLRGRRNANLAGVVRLGLIQVLLKDGDEEGEREGGG